MLIILVYQTLSGKRPFDEWYRKLKEQKVRLLIRKRVNRLAVGHIGDCKALKEGVFELRIDYGPGYRLYFAQEGQELILLLLGGDKSTQEQDICKAKEYYNDYRART
ncbi:MAG: type II toxin-antitoxin system RelE/ParE family toxin [Candidatus Omnitrophica bacterium]|nr:type II toxin-antitoxin system RelE/ParE family toxin [Candidatus Omnitrophota bacterium]